MLFISGEMSKPVRLQSAFISEEEVKKIVKYLKRNYEDELPNNFDITDEDSNRNGFEEVLSGDVFDEDELYEDAKRSVIEAGKASTSYLQRKLRVGYARAARLMDMLEERGIIGPQDGARPREILDDDSRDGSEYEEGYEDDPEDNDEEDEERDYDEL